MNLPPEAVWGGLLVLLLGGLIWGLFSYRMRNKRMDRVSEDATKQVMDDPGPEPMKGDRPQPPGGMPSAKR
jgi:hypothetical protein